MGLLSKPDQTEGVVQAVLQASVCPSVFLQIQLSISVSLSLHIGSLVVSGWVGQMENVMQLSDREGLCSYWQLVTAVLTSAVYHIAQLDNSHA